MKRIILAGAVIFSALATQAQTWIDLGVKAGYTPGISLNTNVFDDEAYKLQFGHGYQYGAKLAVNFGPFYSVSGDVMWTTLTNVREVSGEVSELTLNYMEIPILFRYNQENGAYSEIGPSIGLFRGAKSSSNIDGLEDQFNGTNYGIVVGMGQYIGGGSAFGMNIGFRAGYTFNDIISSDFQTEVGNAVYTPVTPGENSFSYKASNNIYFGLVLELNFNVGYFQQGSNCHKNTRFKLF